MDEMSNEAKTTTKTSGSSDSVLRLECMKPTVVTTTKPALSNTATTKRYKGVLQLENGLWVAHIYADHRRFWLGTFKSAVEAATAYDIASIKLRSFVANSHRNFPWPDFTVHESNFQECYTKEDVLNMIRDGSYQYKFRDFLRVRSRI